jgi:hypothetical protein
MIAEFPFVARVGLRALWAFLCGDGRAGAIGSWVAGGRYFLPSFNSNGGARMRFVPLASFLLASAFSAVANADDQAATSKLPAALQQLGVSEASVVSADEAAQVRGEGGNYHFLGGLKQSLDFSISNGSAIGNTTLLEGVLGNFTYDNGEGFTAEGVFGGLSGHIGGWSGGSLKFDLQGKAVNTTIDFITPDGFNLDFSQLYHR